MDARGKLHIPWDDPSNQAHGDTMMGFDTRSVLNVNGMVESKVFQQYLPSIRALWADSGIQNAYDRRREFQLVSRGGGRRAGVYGILNNRTSCLRQESHFTSSF